MYFKLGSSTQFITLLPDFFKLDLTTNIWKLEASITAVSSNGINTGKSSYILYRNQPPVPGKCEISPTIGISMKTIFTIKCSNWVDDGFIAKYEYFSNFFYNKFKIDFDLILYFKLSLL